ncbi:MAG: peptidylprolyl isomerase [Pelagibacterales bacterium]|nr:peptidylprolyl isomerase [Pelagibacterales bacterium]
MNFLLKIMLKTLLIIIFVQSYSLATENVKIILKINDEIVTNVDIQKEYNYLIALNNDFKEVNKEKALLIAKESIIKEKIKKKEIEKYYDLEENNDYFKNVFKNFYKSLGLNNKKEFKKYIEKYGLTYRDVKQKIKIETVWNDLIYNKYNEQVKIDLKKLRKTIIKQKENQNSYLLYEILFKNETNEDVNKKYELIKRSIESVGFKNSANIYSIASTSKVGGKIGWINENQLSKEIVKELEKLKINEYSKPINLTEGYLILKVENIKKIKNNNLDIDKELKRLANYEKNKQLNKMSNIFFSKIKNNTIINEI